MKKMFPSDIQLPWQRWDVILSSILLNLLTLVLPLVIMQLYNRVIPNHGYSTLSMLCLGAFIAAVWEIILSISRSHILSWLGMNFSHKTSVYAFAHLLYGKASNLNTQGVGHHFANMEGIGQLREFLAGQGFLMLLDLPFVLLFIGLMSYLSLEIGLIVISILSIFIVVAFHVGKKLQDSLQQRLDYDNRINNFVIEILGSHHTLKSLGMEELILRRYERIISQSSAVEYTTNFYSAEARDVSSSFGYLMLTGIAVGASLAVIKGHTSVGAMSACIMLANRIMQPVQMLMGMWSRLQHFKIAKTRLSEMVNLEREDLRASKGISTEISGKITITDMDFAYGDKHVLKDINLLVPKGSLITIHGENGAGKTTLMLLLLGVLDPKNGTINIDDQSISNYNIKHLRRQMGYLPPKGMLFEGTILENITMFQEGDTIDAALETAHLLGLDEWVAKLPNGYETRIGNNLAASLPGGIQQQICLARILINHPKILILDEGNTVLDERGEQRFYRLLQQLRGSTTIIFVTHRPSLQRIADASYEIKEGRLTRKHQPDILMVYSR